MLRNTKYSRKSLPPPPTPQPQVTEAPPPKLSSKSPKQSSKSTDPPKDRDAETQENLFQNFSFSESVFNQNVIPRPAVDHVIKAITEELISRGLSAPYLLLPYRPDVDYSQVRTLVATVFPRHMPSLKDESLFRELRKSDVYILASFLKWCWARLPGGVISWHTYENFKEQEKASGYPTDAFLTILPKCAESESHGRIIGQFFDLMYHVACYGRDNGLPARKLCRLAGTWAFELRANKQQKSSTPRSFATGLDLWHLAAEATHHLFVSFLKCQRLSLALQNAPLPRSLEMFLTASTEVYPPKPPSRSKLLGVPMITLVVHKLSSSPEVLLKRVAKTIRFDNADIFDSEEDFNVLYYLFESPMAVMHKMTPEGSHVLQNITKENPLTTDHPIYIRETPKLSYDIRARTWSKYYNHAYIDPVTGVLRQPLSNYVYDDSELVAVMNASVPSQEVSTIPYPTDVVDDLTEWGKFGPGDSRLILNKDVLARKMARDRVSADNLISAELSKVYLDDFFVWVWMSSQSEEQTEVRKATFGRSVVIEVRMTEKLRRWIVVEERLHPEPGPLKLDEPRRDKPLDKPLPQRPTVRAKTVRKPVTPKLTEPEPSVQRPPMEEYRRVVSGPVNPQPLVDALASRLKQPMVDHTTQTYVDQMTQTDRVTYSPLQRDQSHYSADFEGRSLVTQISHMSLTSSKKDQSISTHIPSVTLYPTSPKQDSMRRPTEHQKHNEMESNYSTPQTDSREIPFESLNSQPQPQHTDTDTDTERFSQEAVPNSSDQEPQADDIAPQHGYAQPQLEDATPSPPHESVLSFSPSPPLHQAAFQQPQQQSTPQQPTSESREVPSSPPNLAASGSIKIKRKPVGSAPSIPMENPYTNQGTPILKPHSPAPSEDTSVYRTPTISASSKPLDQQGPFLVPREEGQFDSTSSLNSSPMPTPITRQMNSTPQQRTMSLGDQTMRRGSPFGGPTRGSPMGGMYNGMRGTPPRSQRMNHMTGQAMAMNGMHVNGMHMNGMHMNGMPMNGMPMNPQMHMNAMHMGNPMMHGQMSMMPMNGMPAHGQMMNGQMPMMPMNGMNGMPMGRQGMHNGPNLMRGGPMPGSRASSARASPMSDLIDVPVAPLKYGGGARQQRPPMRATAGTTAYASIPSTASIQSLHSSATSAQAPADYGSSSQANRPLATPLPSVPPQLTQPREPVQASSTPSPPPPLTRSTTDTAELQSRFEQSVRRQVHRKNVSQRSVSDFDARTAIPDFKESLPIPNLGLSLDQFNFGDGSSSTAATAESADIIPQRASRFSIIGLMNAAKRRSTVN